MVLDVVPIINVFFFFCINVGFIAIFQCWSKQFSFDSIVTRVCQLPYDIQGILSTFGRCSVDYIPNKYLTTLKSIKQLRLSKYLAQGHKHVGGSGAWTHGSTVGETALPSTHCALSKGSGSGLELQILKGTHFKAILKGQLREPRSLHVKE